MKKFTKVAVAAILLAPLAACGGQEADKAAEETGEAVEATGEAVDTAAEEASYLAKLCKKVYLIVRKDQMRASQIMQKRVLNTPNIEILWNSVTEEILGEDKVEGMRIKNTVTNELKDYPVTGFFVAIGHEPNSGIFKDYLDMDENNTKD